MNDTESQLLSLKRKRIAKLESLLAEVETFAQDVYKHPLPEAGGSYIWDLHRQAGVILDKLKGKEEPMTPEDYLKRPYQFIMIRDDESGTWTGRVKEFPGCIAQAAYNWEILLFTWQAALDWIEAALDLGQEMPEPEMWNKERL